MNTDGDAILEMYGDDGDTAVAYLGGNKKNVATSKDEPTGRQPHRLSDESGFAQDAWLFEKGNTLLRDSGLPCWGGG